jgi:hypothetical protein
MGWSVIAGCTLDGALRFAVQASFYCSHSLSNLAAQAGGGASTGCRLGPNKERFVDPASDKLVIVFY